MRAKVMRALLGACIALLVSTAAMAAYPDKPIRLVVPYAVASATDLVARKIMPKLAEALGQPIVIDNKPGASAVIGAKEVAQAKPDGYTLLLGGIQTHGINTSLIKNLSYDAIADFVPVARLNGQPLLLVVGSKLGIKTLPELIAYAKANPGKANFASTGSGTSTHLANELFNSQAGVKFLHVPYKNVPQSLVDLENGDVTMFFYTYGPVLPFLQRGTLTVLATTNQTRMAVIPQVPTMAESGYPNTSILAWQAIYAPAGTPREVVNVLYRAAERALADPALRKSLQEAGTEIWFANPEETAEFTRSEIDRMREAVRLSGASPD